MFIRPAPKATTPMAPPKAATITKVRSVFWSSVLYSPRLHSTTVYAIRKPRGMTSSVDITAPTYIQRVGWPPQ